MLPEFDGWDCFRHIAADVLGLVHRSISQPHKVILTSFALDEHNHANARGATVFNQGIFRHAGRGASYAEHP